MKNKRRAAVKYPDLFTSSVTPTHRRTFRLEKCGNYATRSVRRWILSDNAAVSACHDLIRKDLNSLALRLAAWFMSEVGLTEPSSAYAEYLATAMEVEWQILADELLSHLWEGP